MSTPDTPTPLASSQADTGAALRLLDRPISSAELEAGSEWAARAAETRGGAMIGLLLFGLGDETAALPAKLLRRVTPEVRPVPIPHRASGLLRGLCNIRGELIPCADMHRMLGLPDRTSPGGTPTDVDARRRMVLIGPAEAPWAFEVDCIIGFERVEAASLRPPPITVRFALADFTTGIADIKGQTVTVLDGERVLKGFLGGLS
ncbi:MAG: chemotaxis protein CheW [Phycisphaerales bacterium]|nr:chemotaxis protein CheW [Phycisphaerales bacterium]